MRRGFTLIESVICIVVAASLIVAALGALGASARVQSESLARSWAEVLAEDLMAEILVLPYEDPETPGGAMGPDGAEDDGTRANFDDIDDFHQWVAPVPEAPDGTPLDVPSGFLRKVTVRYMDPADLTKDTGFELGVKRIRVTVEFDKLPLIELDAFRTSAWSPPWESDA